MRRLRIYLAGPEVFLPDFGKPVFDAKKEMCADLGFVGVSPMDGAPHLEGLSPFAQGVAIYRGNLEHMDSCDAVVANMTPFRGVSMDAGTAFEMGYMAAKGKLVMGYTHVTTSYEERSERYYARQCSAEIDAYSAGTAIESFDMSDNLMMVGAVELSGGRVQKAGVPPGEELTALDGFRWCLQELLGHRSRERVE